ncbi:MAG: hypothetical protein AAB794_03410 [Patescibacteria group bacterium]
MKEINPASQVCSIFSRNPVARNMLYLVLVLGLVALVFVIDQRFPGFLAMLGAPHY